MILGLDMATKKTGYGLLDAQANLYDYGIIRTTSEEPRERIKEVYDAIERIINENNITQMVFEDVPVTSHNNLKTGKTINKLTRITNTSPRTASITFFSPTF